MFLIEGENRTEKRSLKGEGGARIKKATGGGKDLLKGFDPGGIGRVFASGKKNESLRGPAERDWRWGGVSRTGRRRCKLFESATLSASGEETSSGKKKDNQEERDAARAIKGAGITF